MDSTIIQQGRFTSDGVSEVLSLRSGVDWMEVINETQFAAQQTPGRGVKFEWQKGMAAGHAFEYSKADGADTLQAEKVTAGGFTVIDPNAGAEAPVTGTSITNANPPVCTATAHGYSNGDIVILSNLVTMPQISSGNALFTIGNVTANTFELSFFDASGANFVAETGFVVRRIPPFSWKGSWNTISSIATGTTTAVTFCFKEDELIYSIGSVLKFSVPSVYGMSEINGLQGIILSYTAATNTYIVDVDSSAFSAFVWPAASAVPLSPPIAIPFGSSGNSLGDATNNLANLSIKLGAGIDGPAGSTGDVIYWKAGKSFSMSNA